MAVIFDAKLVVIVETFVVIYCVFPCSASISSLIVVISVVSPATEASKVATSASKAVTVKPNETKPAVFASICVWVTALIEPVSPLSPLGPCEPVAPVAPCGPVSPCEPCKPCVPCGPCGPITPPTWHDIVALTRPPPVPDLYIY